MLAELLPTVLSHSHRGFSPVLRELRNLEPFLTVFFGASAILALFKPLKRLKKSGSTAYHRAKASV